MNFGVRQMNYFLDILSIKCSNYDTGDNKFYE